MNVAGLENAGERAGTGEQPDHDEHVEDDAGSGKHFETATQTTVFAIHVLLPGPTIEKEHQDEPDAEVQNGADTEAIGRQISALEVGKSAFTRRGRVEPGGVEVFHSKEDGHEKHRDESQDSRGGLQGAANDDAPIAASQMLKHQEAERTQRKA